VDSARTSCSTGSVTQVRAELGKFPEAIIVMSQDYTIITSLVVIGPSFPKRSARGMVLR
jgi:hypothetical protein